MRFFCDGLLYRGYEGKVLSLERRDDDSKGNFDSKIGLFERAFEVHEVCEAYKHSQDTPFGTEVMFSYLINWAKGHVWLSTVTT